jgi:hypothetical protein
LPALPSRQERSTSDGIGCPTRPLWIDDDLVAYTQQVWSRCLARPVPEDEAVEMLVNVRRLGEALYKIIRWKGEADEGCDLGEGVLAGTAGGLLHRRPNAGDPRESRP